MMLSSASGTHKAAITPATVACTPECATHSHSAPAMAR
jgi:hypothetical protein